MAATGHIYSLGDAMKRSDLFIRLTAAVLFLAVASYVGVYIYNALVTTYVTTEAIGYSIEETVPTQGYIIRTETVLTDAGSSVLPIVGEGEKVALGQTVAVELLGREALETAAEIRSINMRIMHMESLGGNIEEAALQSVISLSKAIHSSDLSKLDELSYSIRTHIFSDSSLSPNEELSILRTRLMVLEARNEEMRAIRAPVSGTFSHTVDGFEHIEPGMLTDIFPSRLEDLFSAPAFSVSAGKLVTEFTWFYATVMNVSDAARITVGDRMTVQFSGIYNAEFDMLAQSIGRREGDNCVVVFSSDISIHNIAALRQLRADVVLGTVDGIRVPKEAIHLDDDGATYLYLQSGVRAERVDVEILREAGDGYLVRDGAESGTPLRIGSIIIVRANNLFHGKVVG